MYDILQLNDMLVPELLDIAEQLDISNAKKLNKQDLVYRILDKQAIMNAAAKNEDEKPKRNENGDETTGHNQPCREDLESHLQDRTKRNVYICYSHG